MLRTFHTSNLNRLAALVGLLLLIFAVAFAASTWNAVRADQISQMRTVLELSQKGLDRYLLQAEIGLRELSIDITDSGGLVDMAVAGRYLNRYAAMHPESASISLLRVDGQILVTSLPTGVGQLPSMAQDPSFKAFLASQTDRSGMVLGRPRVGNISKAWVFPMRYAIRDARGSAVAFLSASLPVAMLESFWRSAPVVQRASIGLLGDDGYLMSRFPIPDGRTKEEIYGQRRMRGLGAHLAELGYPTSGYMEGMASLSGVQTANAYLRLERYPATVFVSMPTSDFFAAWRDRVAVPFGLILSFAGLGFMAFYTMAKNQASLETRRLASANALRNSEADQRFLVDHMVAGVAILGPDGSVQSANPQARRILNLPDELPMGQLVPGDGWQLLREDGTQLAPEESPVRRVVSEREAIREITLGVARTAGDPPIWLQCSFEPELETSRAIRRVVLTFIDITARRNAERAFARSERRFRLLFENSLDGVMQTRPDGSVVNANRAACNLFGVEEASIVRSGRGRFTDGSDPRLHKLIADREAFGRASGQIAMFRADGSRFEAEVSSSSYVDDDGECYCSVVVRDVTDRKISEAALAARDVAESANRAKSRFVAHMSHELRTPLNAILGFAHVLGLDRRQPLTVSQRVQVEHIHRAGDHLLSMIDNLLDLSRIEAGAAKLTLGDVDPVAVAMQAVRELSVRALQGGLTVTVETPGQAIGLLRTDATRLKQLILNLVSNAIKYNRQGGSVTLKVALEEGVLVVEVADTGIGMSGEQLQTLYQPFNRLGREESGVEGTGIGLVITKALAELMGGKLNVESCEGTGSSFRFELPQVPIGAAIVDVPTPSSVAHIASDSSLCCRVLYIDDNAVNRLVVEALLQLRGDVELTLASDGEEGVVLAKAIRPDLILVDVQMPGLDGFGVVRAVRAAPELFGVRCVAVSASAMPEEIDEAMSAGFDDYLTKPLPPGVLMPEVDRAIRARSASLALHA